MSDWNRIDPAEVRALMARGDLQLIDVRKPADWQKECIRGAVLGEDEDATATLDKSAETVVYCYRGVSSLAATARLAHRGFTRISSMDGGFTAWKTLFGDDAELVEQPPAQAED